MEPQYEEIEQLEPKNLWAQFVEISRIPRRSREESRIRDYVISQARKLELESIVDSTGNLLVRKEGRGGMKDASITILQSHLDMVCVAEKGKEHDFGNDPIDLFFDGTYVKAKGTTLGADNGIGVAAMLALMEDNSLETGPLEFLYTVDEETGLTGALDLSESLLRGRRLLNLDTAEEGILYIGCAGGLNVNSTLSFTGTPAEVGNSFFSVRVGGLTGGHSGLDIDKCRANALKVMAELLRGISRSFDMTLLNIEGGDKCNVIPREAEATMMVKGGIAEEIRDIVQRYCSHKREEFGTMEPELKIELQEIKGTSATEDGMDRESTDRLIDVLSEVPHGPLTMSSSFPNLVESSANLATVKTEGNQVVVGMNCRSPQYSTMRATADSIGIIGARFEMKTERGSEYPGWQPDLNSPLLKQAQNVYLGMFGKEPEVKATHAGLECGVIGGKYPGMDIISFGADVKDLHSPAERVDVSSVGRFWKFLRALVETLTAEKQPQMDTNKHEGMHNVQRQ